MEKDEEKSSNASTFGSQVVSAIIDNPTYIEHRHSVFEIMYVLIGTVYVFTESGTYELNEGDLIYQHGDQIHASYALPGSRAAIFACHPDKVPFFSEQYKAYANSNCLIHTKSNPIMQTVIHLLNTNTNLTDQPHWLISTINLLLMIVAEELPTAKPASNPINFPEELSNALNYIYRNMPHILSLNEVSSELHISPYTLSRMFNEYLQIGFPAYQSILQVNAARRMLSQTTLSVNEISQRCGFSNIRSFDRSFLRYAGCTAGQYRASLTSPFIVNYCSPFLDAHLTRRYLPELADAVPDPALNSDDP